MRTIVDFIARRPVVLSPEASVYEGARAMREQGVGSVVLADPGGGIVGIVTDRDIACRVLAAEGSPETPLSEIASTDVVTALEDMTIREAVTRMVENGIRRLPVVEERRDGTQRCVGMVSADDLIASGELGADDTREIVRSQISWRFQRGPFMERARRRNEHKEAEYYKLLAKTMNVERETAVALSRAVLPLIVRRILYSEAADFISRFPRKVQEELLLVEPGPDVSIDAETIVAACAREIESSEDAVRELLPLFWSALELYFHEDSEEKGELSHVLAQLPRETCDLFLRSPQRDAV